MYNCVAGGWHGGPMDSEVPLRHPQLLHNLLRTVSLLHREPLPGLWSLGFFYIAWFNSRGGGQIQGDQQRHSLLP